jgi:hypothetical protein
MASLSLSQVDYPHNCGVSNKNKNRIAAAITAAMVGLTLALFPSANYLWELWQTYTQTHTQTHPVPLDPQQEATLAGLKTAVVQFQFSTETDCYPYIVPDNNAFYCPLENTIYFGHQLNSLSRPVRIFIYAHEGGHAVSTLPPLTSPRLKERDADRHGGQVIKSLVERHVLKSSDINQITNWLSTLKSNDEHDPGPKRVKAFLDGYNS